MSAELIIGWHLFILYYRCTYCTVYIYNCRYIISLHPPQPSPSSPLTSITTSRCLTKLKFPLNKLKLPMTRRYWPSVLLYHSQTNSQETVSPIHLNLKLSYHLKIRLLHPHNQSLRFAGIAWVKDPLSEPLSLHTQPQVDHHGLPIQSATLP